MSITDTMCVNFDQLVGFYGEHAAEFLVPRIRHGDRVFMVSGYGVCLESSTLNIDLVEICPADAERPAKPSEDSCCHGPGHIADMTCNLGETEEP